MRRQRQGRSRAPRRPRPDSSIIRVPRRQAPRALPTSGLRLAADAKATDLITIRAPRRGRRPKATKRSSEEDSSAEARRRVRPPLRRVRPSRRRVRPGHRIRASASSPSFVDLRGPLMATADRASSRRRCCPPPGNAPRQAHQRRRTSSGSTGSCAPWRCNEVGPHLASPPLVRSGGGCSRLAFCMKTAHTFSFLRTTSDIFASSLSQRKGQRVFCFSSSALSSYSLREAASFFLIGRSVMQRRGQLACSPALFFVT